jgi:hypothetical protein
MSNLRTSVQLDLAGNLQSKARSYGNALDVMARRGTRSMNMLRRSTRAMGQGLDRLGNRYTALITGAAGAGTVKMLMGLQTRFTRLGIQASADAEQMELLKRRIYEVAQAPQIRVDPGEITSAIETIVERTGDLKFAEDNIGNIGMAIRATGAAGGDIGGLLAEFQKQGITSAEAVLQALDTLTEQGKMGAFTLQNLASLGPRVVTAYTSMGRSGPMAMREMGAALQMIMMGSGNAEQAATAFEATLRTLSDPKKLKLLGRAGVQVFDVEKLKEGQRILRPINEIMAEIIRTTGGDKVKLGRIFDAEAVRAFNQANAEFMKSGRLESLDRFMDVHGTGAQLMSDSARAAKDAEASMTALYTAWQKFADSRLTAPIQKAADVLNSLGSEGADTAMSAITYGAAGLGALVLGRKAYKGARALGGLFGRGKGAKGGLGGLLGGMSSGPIPVYVVNNQMSMMPDSYGGGWQGGSGKTGASVARRGGRFGRVRGAMAGAGKWAGRAAGALALAGTAYELYDAWSDDKRSTDAKVNASGRAVGSGLGGWGGAVAGAQLGAAIGSIVPGLGTAIGAIIGTIGGGIAGAWAGGNLGGQAMDKFGFHDQERPEGRLRIEVSDDRTRVTRLDARGMEMDVDSGMYMAGVGQ